MSSALLSRFSPNPHVASPTPTSPPPPPLPPDSIYTSCYCEENIYLLAQTFTQLSESNATERRGPWPWQIFVVFISNGGKTVALWNQKAARDSDTGVVVWDYHVVLVLLPVSVPVSVPRRDGGAPHASVNGPHERSGPGTHLCDTVTERSDRPERPPGDANANAAAAAFPTPAPESRAPAPAPVPAPAPACASADSWPLSPSELGRGEGGGEAWVYDFDTTLVPVPCPWRDYVAGTFPYAFDRRLADQIDERFHSLFRVIPADVYLDHFASDRSHMIVPPPAPRQDGELGHGVEHLPDTAESDTDPAPLDDGGSGGSGTAGSRGIDEADEAIPEGPRYSMPPPPYPPLRGTKARALGVTNNLMASFVSMSLSHVRALEVKSTPAPIQHEGTVSSGPDSDSEHIQPRATIDSGSVHSGWQLPSALSKTLAEGYGQVMDLDGFVAWLAGPSGSEKAV